MEFGSGDYFNPKNEFSDDPFIRTDDLAEVDEEGNPIVPDGELNFTHEEIGTATNPMGNTLQSLKERIMQGNRKIEFSFIGQGKGNSQQPTPESFGSLDRQDIREMLTQNEMKTSTHAGVHSQSLAGFTRENFSGEAREAVLKEIKKAIDFSATATKGGAIVFHFQEWMRPLSEVKDSQFSNAKFKSFAEEDEEAPKLVIDSKTGHIIPSIAKNQEVYRPIYMTAKDKGLVGKKDPNGHVFRENDWLDMHGNFIPRNADANRLIDRVPKYNYDTNHFDIQQLSWNDLVKEAKEYNNMHNEHITPEELFAKTQLENQAAAAMGNSLFHGRYYETEERKFKLLKQKWDSYNEAKSRVPDDKKDKLAKELLVLFDQSDPELLKRGATSQDYEKEFLKNLKLQENALKHIHESSATADAQAEEYKKKAKRIMSIEKYGVQKTAETVANAGMEAMRKYQRYKTDLDEPIYVAPENWDTRFYGSHPEEYMNLIKASRERMQKQLVLEGHSKEEANKLAKTHIKGTLDVGHLNLFRSNFEAKDGETPEERDKRFNKWLLKWTDKLTKEGYVGHIHLADNFGYDDEHLSPGQGNIPMKDFLKIIEKNKIKDIIVEQGSYNIGREVPDTLELIGSPIYGVKRAQRFRQVRNAHFGYGHPSYFIAGPYVPSNEWKPWSDVPLE
ncbi:hypothetical protein K9L97_03770 [Candidatus Woesearchaeota archaeon]|nr:hypothetical protein [Candidatus Woesearchaeota archaeon]